jgi:hypothetical protein
MEVDIRQVALVAIAVIVPIILLWTKRERWLLGWVCVTFFLQIFDTVIITNLPAGRIVGLLYLPVALKQLKEWSRLKPVKAWAINYIYLLVLAVFFGLIWPWPDITLARPFTLTAPGRGLIYSVRLLSDLSLTIFIANQIRRPGSLLYLGRAMVLGSTMTAVVGLCYFVSKIDLYYLITGLGEQGLKIERARGLSIEPRALGLACAYGIMILLLGRKRLFKPWIALVFLNLAGLMITYSASSLALLVSGVISAGLFFTNRERGTVILTLALAGLLVFGASLYMPNQFQSAIETIRLRLDPDYKLSDMPPGDFGQEVAYRLDVFDACALLFLLDEPLYALIGAGPGMVSLPASYYVPPGLYSFIWNPSIGINSPPSHGLLLELTNSGLPGLIIWFVQVISCLSALRYILLRLRDHNERAEWKFGYSLFLIGSVFYLVQVSSSPVWSLFLAIGWVACQAAREEMAESNGNEQRTPVNHAAIHAV